MEAKRGTSVPDLPVSSTEQEEGSIFGKAPELCCQQVSKENAGTFHQITHWEFHLQMQVFDQQPGDGSCPSMRHVLVEGGSAPWAEFSFLAEI